MSERLKGFVFGAFLMLVTPALALPQAPKASVDEIFSEQPQVAAESLPYFRLTYTDAEEAISHALAERGAGAKVAADIANNAGDDYLFTSSQPINVEIRGLRFEAANHRFNANLVAVSEGKVISARAISGRYNELVEVPVLKQAMRAGEVIKSSDLELRDYPKARARADTITDMASLVGKSPERVISAGRPIRAVELAQPSVVKKNDMVKMVYNEGAMSISTTGQVLSDGVLGSVVSVRNLASKKVVQGTVQDKNTIIISTGDSLQASRASVGGIYEN